MGLLVPAFAWLYGSIDRLIGHHRRYHKRELQVKLTEAGFVVRHLGWMNAIGILPWFVNNRLLRRTHQSSAQVRLFDRAVVPWVEPLERWLPPPWGLSLVAVAEKPVALDRAGDLGYPKGQG